MKHAKTRGIVAVRAQGGDVKSLIQGMDGDIRAFKERHQSEVKELRDVVDEHAGKIAALNLNGTGAQTSHRLPPQAAADFTQYLRAGRMGDSLIEPQAAMQSGNPSDGGASIPKQISDTILNQLVELSPMRQLASVERATTSDFTKVIGLRGASSGWAAETDPRTLTDTPKMGTVAPTMGEAFAYVEATSWVLEDSQFDLAAWLSENVADEFATREGSAFFAGDGTSKPTGFLAKPQSPDDDATRPFGTVQTVEATAAAAIESDDLVSLMGALRTPYRQRADDVAWIMNRATASAIRSLKDTTGRFLWNDGLAAGTPPTLLGFRVMESEDMPGVAAGQVSIAFGNWRAGYLIVDRTDMRVLRDPYTKPGWTKFYFHKRVGGDVADSNAIKLLIHPAV
jgi:HK97 family phage major capsid protein